jgi:hypothetical protein
MPALTLFHGTGITSALRLVNGEPLDSDKAAALKIDGSPGFYLSTDYGDATYFAVRRAPGGIIQYDLSQSALDALRLCGLKQQPIPPGGKSLRFSGDEVVVPVDAFDGFNQLLAAAEIVVSPARGAI